jgi:cholesterol transport system auxiliary component
MSDTFFAPLATRRALLVSSASALVLAGCGNLIGPNGAPPQIYLLAPPLQALPNAGTASWPLSIALPRTSESLNTQRIALKRGAVMDYYADAQWSDMAPQLLQTLIVNAFEKSGGIAAVARDVDGIRADFLLDSEVREFEARYDSEGAPPTIVVSVMAKLLTAQAHDVVGTHETRHETPATANSVAAVVAAFDVATAAVLEDLVAWTIDTGQHASAAKQSADAPAAEAPQPAHRRHRQKASGT